jgi:hypothetical protein
MFLEKTVLEYPSLLILSNAGKKSFEALGKIAKKSGDTISRLLRPAEESIALMRMIARTVFANDKKIFIVIDESVIRKMFSKLIQGVGYVFDNILGTEIRAYKLLACCITNGIYSIPIGLKFIYSKDVLPNPSQSKDDMVKQMILEACELFKDKKITVVQDGAFATTKLFSWAYQNNIAVEARMPRNRVVEYKGQRVAICNIRDLIPKGRQMARTISVLWHGIPLEITAQLRIDKNGKETVVYQAATYKAKPSEHVKNYEKRWRGVETVFRTMKQHLGLQECFSTKAATQFSHVASVLLAYALVQWECKKRKITVPEEALRALKRKNSDFLKQRFAPILQGFPLVYA